MRLASQDHFLGEYLYADSELETICCRYPDCTSQPGLTGELLEKPKKIILMMIFSFEVDTLEVALKEQQDLVDKIFIVESSATHKGVS